MNKLIYLLITVFIVIVSCNQVATNCPEKNPLTVYSKASGCKRALYKSFSGDSICGYEFFDDSLKITIKVQANCCPETNRFTTSTSVKEDSVHLKVRDTAKELCDCICPYEIQTIIKGAAVDSIYFTCEYNTSLIADRLIRRN
ncbi:MAG TPA: hypothetical protein VHO70_24150 [Chitinispirillaceae bacterium]|nr:hypothetical protein [Chitinispirillaceae bacterium]